MKRFWTDEDMDLAARMIAENAPNEDFVDRLGRTRSAAKRRLYYIRSRGAINTVRGWSDEDTLTAIEMLKAKAPPEEFLRRLNRTMSGAIQRRAHYEASERIREMRAKRWPLTSLLTGKNAPPAHVMQEAVRALTAPRSLTSLICQDPAPGRSALDRRNAANAAGSRA